MTTRPYGPTGETTTTIGLGGAFLTASSFADGVATVRRARAEEKGPLPGDLVTEIEAVGA